MEITKETYNVVDLWDLQLKVKHTYGLDANFAIAEEWDTPDSCYEFQVHGVLERKDYETFKTLLCLERIPTYGITRLFLNILCHDKFIKPGLYLIRKVD